MTAVIQASSDALVRLLREWLSEQEPLRLVVIEGLMGAGKSTLLNALRSDAATVELDRLLERNGPTSEAWVDRVIARGGHLAIASGMESAPLVIVEGAVAWPVVGGCTDLPHDQVRRVYIKKMSMSGGQPWWPEESLLAHWLAEAEAAGEEFWASIHRYHLTKPWEEADLVIERLDTPEAEPTPESEFEKLTGLSWPGDE